MAEHFFSPNLEYFFEEGKGTLHQWEIRIYRMWQLITYRNIRPWEHDLDYDENEKMIKPEDLADIFKLDQFNYNAEKTREKRANAEKVAAAQGMETKVLPGAFKKK